ncbi:hypothetical protein TUMSATVNIG3_01860 [Vibrio nigripulchritudo]|nr:hypothetical protein TUMSATVNIG2_01870 [Vibrio nigripulchritudo]BDU41388.1 hypothetical protein TUMSATVNIG3_01860 [Vibrio nigripulchritudo]
MHAMTISKGAEMRKRIPVAVMGGMDSTATSIAIHVVPQIKHTVAKVIELNNCLDMISDDCEKLKAILCKQLE